MKSETRFGTRNRLAKRKARVLTFYGAPGKLFAVVRSGNGELLLPAHIANPLSKNLLVSQIPTSGEQTSLPVYSSAEIRQAGGIDALSEAIGNNHSIKVPLIEFSGKEWKGMINDLDNDK